ncbi:MAG: Formyl-CoA transferase [Myxococcales bacterium]|nr:Formyl-CoA transferase [Myxococcales bacterium]
MLPLDDLTVLDLSRILSGPYCSMYLADFGARVIKLEHPTGGDDTRGFGPPFVAGESTYFMSINRNKESVAIDFKHARGGELVRALAARADILLENFRPGALERLGLDYASLRTANPRLIYCSISGFGHTGEPDWVRRPGYDLAIQGMGGLASLTGPADGPPHKVGTSIADMIAGLYALSGILVALHARARTGRGQHVDVSMLDGQISLLTYHAGIHFATGGVPARRGNQHPSISPYETYRAKDGFVNIAVGNDAQWRALCRAAGEPLQALAEDPRFATNAARVGRREELAAILEPLVATRSVDDWIALCDGAGIPSGPILDVAQALAHPQVRARGMVVPLEHPSAGPIRVTGVPVRLSETPGAVRTPPPRLGEHTRAVLAEVLGLDGASVDALVEEGAAKSV